jgi:hypothetical protein
VRFCAHAQYNSGAHPNAYTRGSGPFLGVKRPGRGAEDKERGVLYVNIFSGSSTPVLGENSPFPENGSAMNF